MNVFLDANILVAIIKREAKRAEASAKVLSLANNAQFKIYVSAISVATAFYYAGKKIDDAWAKRQLAVLCGKLFIARCDEAEMKQALVEKKVHDLEDGLQYFAARNAGCEALITYNTGDFYFSQIPIYMPEDFLLQLSKNDKRK